MPDEVYYILLVLIVTASWLLMMRMLQHFINRSDLYLDDRYRARLRRAVEQEIEYGKNHRRQKMFKTRKD
jgi:hypothetical protein